MLVNGAPVASSIALGSGTNDFGGAVSATGSNIALADGTGGLVLGNVSAGGTLTAASTGGAITQDSSGSNLLVTAGAATFVASAVVNGAAVPADVTLSAATNDFGGTVNATGGNISLADGAGGLVLGNVDSSGTLSASSTGGAIAQAVGSTILVDAATTLSARQLASGVTVPANISLNGAANDFGSVVNVLSSDAVTLRDANSLSLGAVTATGDLRLASIGILNLGAATVGGALYANSNGGNIVQDGSLQVAGLANFDAGAGSVSLTNPSNQFAAGTTVLASQSVLTGDGRRMANELAAQAQTALPVVPSPIVALANASAPPPLVLSAQATGSSAGGSSASGSSASSSSSGSAGGAGTGGSTAGVLIDVRSTPSATSSLMAAVSLPKGTAVIGAGFSFELPDTVKATVQQSNQQAQASLPDGGALPAWLKFDAQSLRFEASAVPDGAFPMQVVMTVGQQRVVVVISERAD
jgi:hypothetical protein